MKLNDEKDQMLMLEQKFAEKLHEMRLKKDFSQERFSEIIGITEVYLRCLENGKNIPNWITWLKICTALGVDISEIQKNYIEPSLDLKMKDDIKNS